MNLEGLESKRCYSRSVRSRYRDHIKKKECMYSSAKRENKRAVLKIETVSQSQRLTRSLIAWHLCREKLLSHAIVFIMPGITKNLHLLLKLGMVDDNRPQFCSGTVWSKTIQCVIGLKQYFIISAKFYFELVFDLFLNYVSQLSNGFEMKIGYPSNITHLSFRLETGVNNHTKVFHML